MIIRKGPEEIERIARAGDLVAATIAHVGGQHRARDHDRRAGRDRRRVHRRARRRLGLEGIPRHLSRRDLHLPELDGRPRDPRPLPGRGRRPDHDRRRRRARRRVRRQRLHVRCRGDRPRGPAAARRLPGRARRRDRRGAAREPDRRHLARDADGRGGCRLLGRAQSRRTRRRPALPRGSARPELRPAGPRAEALGGDDDRDRADDHGRLAGGLPARRRLVDLHRGRVARSAFRAHGRDHGRPGRGS